jgi:hypothetical protein
MVLVTCAGCGKKYKGEPAGKKFKCNQCSNLFTFPDSPRSASAGKVLCSNCWIERDAPPVSAPCNICRQLVDPKFGGAATYSASPPAAVSESVAPTPSVQENPPPPEKRPEPEPPLSEPTAPANDAAQQQIAAELTVKIEALQQELLAVQALKDDAEKRAADSEAELKQFREAAVAALEPLGVEYKNRMKGLIRAATELMERTYQMRDEFSRQIDEVAVSIDALKSEMAATKGEIGQRLSSVLGVPASDTDMQAAVQSEEAPDSST